MISFRSVEQRASLTAFPEGEESDFDPDLLTEVLGIAPTSSYRKGEVLKSGRVRKFSAWIWETAERDDRDTEAFVLQVLDVFEPVAARLDDARRSMQLALQVQVVTYMNGPIDRDPDGVLSAQVPTPALYLSPSTVSRIASIGAGFDCDLYVDASDAVADPSGMLTP